MIIFFFDTNFFSPLVSDYFNILLISAYYIDFLTISLIFNYSGSKSSYPIYSANLYFKGATTCAAITAFNSLAN